MTLLKEPTLEVARKLKALDHDIRFKIVQTLLDKGELSFTQLQEETGTAKTTLAYHVDVLTRAGVLGKRYEREGREYIRYSVAGETLELLSKLGLFK